MSNMVILILALTLGVLIGVNLSILLFLVRSRKLEKKKMDKMAFLMHMEMFSLVNWQVILPEGENPSEEHEAERFRKWRYN
jgi:MFS superfamily sulfate permease-like transporter